MRLALPLVVIGFSWFLAGCHSTAAAPVIRPDQIYRGYPCFDHCSAFSSGYDQALQKRLTLPNQCEALPEANRQGCLSYITDFKVDTEGNGGFHFTDSSIVN